MKTLNPYAVRLPELVIEKLKASETLTFEDLKTVNMTWDMVRNNYAGKLAKKRVAILTFKDYKVAFVRHERGGKWGCSLAPDDMQLALHRIKFLGEAEPRLLFVDEKKMDKYVMLYIKQMARQMFLYFPLDGQGFLAEPEEEGTPQSPAPNVPQDVLNLVAAAGRILRSSSS